MISGGTNESFNAVKVALPALTAFFVGVSEEMKTC